MVFPKAFTIQLKNGLGFDQTFFDGALASDGTKNGIAMAPVQQRVECHEALFWLGVFPWCRRLVERLLVLRRKAHPLSCDGHVNNRVAMTFEECFGRIDLMLLTADDIDQTALVIAPNLLASGS